MDDSSGAGVVVGMGGVYEVDGLAAWVGIAVGTTKDAGRRVGSERTVNGYEDDGPAAGGAGVEGVRRGLWVEEPARRRRMPDPVRASAVRAVLIVAVTLILATTAFYLALAGAWAAFPMAIGAVAGTIVATWGVLDVWITRQAWNQRHGVLSAPSSTARRTWRGGGGAAEPGGVRGRMSREDGPLASSARR
ncbi:hypothetical protein ACFV9E_28390 [Streptomyces sp. NPDC059835]|uniref:hypothetical protein n=1 Tax=Streptomyces sp. NPDC059835 TaxID=3346967 RepID=UPI00364D1026